MHPGLISSSRVSGTKALKGSPLKNFSATISACMVVNEKKPVIKALTFLTE